MRISTMGLMALGMGFGVQGDLLKATRDGGTPAFFKSSWTMVPIALGRKSTVNYTYTEMPGTPPTILTLCQTNTPDQMNSDNTWIVTSYEDMCPLAVKPCIFDTVTTVTVPVDLYKGTSDNSTTLQNFFFCLGMNDKQSTDVQFTCETYSPYFNISNGTPQDGAKLVKEDITFPISAATAAPTPISTPSVVSSAFNSFIQSPLRLTQSTGVVGTSPITASQATPTNDGSISTKSTLSLPPTGTTTLPAVLETSPAPKGSSSKGGLSLGAKIGIGLGALGFVLIVLLLALFCLRRRHAKRSISRSEQVMLTQSVHNESRDLVTEKEVATGATLHNPDHDNDTDTESGPPVLPAPTTRHSALSPYETLPSQPYTGSAAAIPRRKPGSAPTSAGSDTLTRGISTHSERTIEIPPSATRASNEHHFEEYHDVPMYSTARAFQGSFLESEDGRSSSAANTTSEEEARRLEEARLEEEEERRIDAAIAEAERKRGTLR